ncbi:transposase [Micromonospora cathayae]|uniref:Transposase n=1 Tax=Micromonospora cathayae TaxID=3028804 RepID=A0ABY7ZSB3_9ACTN|nr:transposase [Micromonospora sp. HUAS 3]WDZ85855.1 transposase [Micromonospora sp. HUAS 3]
MSERFPWLAPMCVWPLAAPLVPRQTARPQGGGARRVDDEAMFAAIAFVLVTDSVWRMLPRVFDVSWQTAHRRFGEWHQSGFWGRLGTAAAAADVPPEVARWATALTAAADRRLSPVRGAVAGDGPPATEPTARRTAVRRYLSVEFAERIFRGDGGRN